MAGLPVSLHRAPLVMKVLVVGAGTEAHPGLITHRRVVRMRLEIDPDVELADTPQASKRCSMCCSSIQRGNRNQT
ncbi:MAG: hypothetical protein WAL61_17965 [Acidimicrobiales bacterium]